VRRRVELDVGIGRRSIAQSSSSLSYMCSLHPTGSGVAIRAIDVITSKRVEPLRRLRIGRKRLVSGQRAYRNGHDASV
jgi:hypothetical protein